MAEKNVKLTPFQQQQQEAAKKVLEYKLGAESAIVSMIYKSPDVQLQNKLSKYFRGNH